MSPAPLTDLADEHWRLTQGDLIRVYHCMTDEDGQARHVSICGVHLSGKTVSRDAAREDAIRRGTLIAAAPRLLKSVERLLERLDTIGHDEDDQAIAEARAARDQARGALL